MNKNIDNELEELRLKLEKKGYTITKIDINENVTAENPQIISGEIVIRTYRECSLKNG